MKPFFRDDSPNYHAWIYCWDDEKRAMVRRQKSLGTSGRKAAEKEAYRLQGIEDEKQRAAQTKQEIIRQIATRYVDNLEGINPDSTIRNYRNCLDIFIQALGDYADRTKLDMNAPPQVRKWLYQHYSGNTIEDRGRFCKRLLLHIIKVTGGEEWWLDDFKIDIQSDGDESPRAMFTDQQLLALKMACETDEERAFLNFAENLGFRIGDGIRLRLSDFKPSSGLMWYLNTKTNKMCGAWLWPKNQEYIRNIMEKSKGKDVPLFPTFNFGLTEDAAAADTWFAKILVKAGIRTDADLIPTKPGWKKVQHPENKRKRKKRYLHSFHSYRVGIISRLASLGVPLHIIMAIVGHKDPRTTRRYIRTLGEDIQAASMLHGARTPGAWQQLASESTAIYLKNPFDQAPTPQHQQLTAPLDDGVPANPVPAAQQAAAVAPTTPLDSIPTDPSAHPSLELVPQQPEHAVVGSQIVFSAQTMHKDAIMLSSVPKGWPGLKPK
ncbi:MAG TPA: site-specific integrase [Terriglobia bacterium]|nr:site-specific integrase [Terriglobia bacterium]